VLLRLITIQCVQKKETKCFFVISSTKLGRFRWNLVYYFLNKFAAKICKHLPPHLNNVSTLPCETWNVHHAGAIPLNCQRKKLQNLSHLNCGLQIRQIWIQLITACGNTAKEGVQNTHHWCGWTETATENGEGQAGSCRHCSIHSSVALSIAADQWCMICTPLSQYFPHAVINWIQTWRISRPQLRWDKFWSFSI